MLILYHLNVSSTEFPTSRLEMSAVADIFDRDGDGYIDYYEFVAALHPNKDAYKPLTDDDKIEDEVIQTLMSCPEFLNVNLLENDVSIKIFYVFRSRDKWQNANVQSDSKWSKSGPTNTG